MFRDKRFLGVTVVVPASRLPTPEDAITLLVVRQAV
jgi:hypothetical protein